MSKNAFNAGLCYYRGILLSLKGQFTQIIRSNNFHTYLCRDPDMQIVFGLCAEVLRYLPPPKHNRGE